MIVAPCFDCNGTGVNPHGNACEFCDGDGAVEFDEDHDGYGLDDDPDEDQP